MNVSRLETTILAGAEAEADDLVAAADARAAEELERARSQAAGLVARAREDGRAAGELESARAVALARRRAAILVLEARRAVYDDFQRKARAAALGLREERSYPALLERLAAEARAALGPDAEVELDPEGAGGVRARSGARSVDLTLPALVEACVARLGDRVTELWR